MWFFTLRKHALNFQRTEIRSIKVFGSNVTCLNTNFIAKWKFEVFWYLFWMLLRAAVQNKHGSCKIVRNCFFPLFKLNRMSWILAVDEWKGNLVYVYISFVDNLTHSRLSSSTDTWECLPFQAMEFSHWHKYLGELWIYCLRPGDPPQPSPYRLMRQGQDDYLFFRLCGLPETGHS